MYREIIDFLKLNDVEYKENLKLGEISTVGIGGTSDFVAYPDSKERLILLLSFLKNNKIRYIVVGRMTNVLFPDEKYSGVVIRTDRISSYTIQENVLNVDCGMTMPYLANALCKAGLSGFEGLSGIPGSIGGAIVGNAGAFGSEIADMLIDVDCFDFASGEVVCIPKSELIFSYRTSAFKQNMSLAILSARFKLCRRNPELIKADMNKFQQIRKSTQPIGQLSLGSTFKRCKSDMPAARLIDECGLKGVTLGGAQVSAKHAGFIVNTGVATAKDYLSLISYIKKCVQDKFGIILEPEIEVIENI